MLHKSVEVHTTCDDKLKTIDALSSIHWLRVMSLLFFLSFPPMVHLFPCGLFVGNKGGKKTKHRSITDHQFRTNRVNSVLIFRNSKSVVSVKVVD